MTEPEQKMWSFLKNKPLGYKFRRQHPFDLYVLDFFCLAAMLAIEIDGPTHDTKSQIIQDQFRKEVLTAYNIHEMRFSNSIVLNDFEIVVEEILDFIASI